MPFDTDPLLMVLVALLLLSGATVKSAMGIGMPLVSIQLLSLLVTPPLAMPCLLRPFWPLIPCKFMRPNHWACQLKEWACCYFSKLSR